MCSSGPDERLKVTAATPAVVSGVIAVFYGSGSAGLYELSGMEKVWSRLKGVYNHAPLLL